MTLAELNTLLRATGYPVAYSHFKDSRTPPYICYLVTDSPNFHADNKTYMKINSVDIELYTTIKDLPAEAKVEAILDANEIPYVSIETFIEQEQLFQKIYEVRLI